MELRFNFFEINYSNISRYPSDTKYRDIKKSKQINSSDEVLDTLKLIDDYDSK